MNYETLKLYVISCTVRMLHYYYGPIIHLMGNNQMSNEFEIVCLLFNVIHWEYLLHNIFPFRINHNIIELCLHTI